MVKNLPADAGDAGLTPGSGRFPEEGNSNPLQYSCLGNPPERSLVGYIVHGVSKSRTQLSNYQQQKPKGKFTVIFCEFISSEYFFFSLKINLNVMSTDSLSSMMQNIFENMLLLLLLLLLPSRFSRVQLCATP